MFASVFSSSFCKLSVGRVVTGTFSGEHMCTGAAVCTGGLERLDERVWQTDCAFFSEKPFSNLSMVNTARKEWC